MSFEPRLQIARDRYPAVLAKILAYAELVDAQGDEHEVHYPLLERELEALVEKPVAGYQLWEWWEAEGAEVLAMRLALPAAYEVELTNEEVFEVVGRLVSVEGLAEYGEFAGVVVGDYFHDLLRLNCPGYRYDLFNRQKNSAGVYFEYSAREIADAILGVG